jgi:hypothetical protein
MVSVGADLQNFESLRKGDEVVIRYTEAIAISVAKWGLCWARTNSSGLSSAPRRWPSLRRSGGRALCATPRSVEMGPCIAGIEPYIPFIELRPNDLA